MPLFQDNVFIFLKSKMQLELEIKIAVPQCLGMENGKEISYGGCRMKSSSSIL